MIKVLFICHGNICRSPMADNDLLALWATLRCLGALVNIATDRADKFLVHCFDILGLITFFSGREGRIFDGRYVVAYG